MISTVSPRSTAPASASAATPRTACTSGDDYLYIEVVDPVTGVPVPDGTMGELVITTLKKQGAPLIRYRTHDLTRIIPGDCACGSRYPRIGTIVGRTDDMVKVKGVNIFPSQIDELLCAIDGASSEYTFTIEHADGRDHCTLAVECEPGVDKAALAAALGAQFKSRIGHHRRDRDRPPGRPPPQRKKDQAGV